MTHLPVADPTKLEPLHTADEVAQFLRVHPSTICRWRQSGKLVGLHVGRKVLFRARDIADLVGQELREAI